MPICRGYACVALFSMGENVTLLSSDQGRRKRGPYKLALTAEFVCYLRPRIFLMPPMPTASAPKVPKAIAPHLDASSG